MTSQFRFYFFQFLVPGSVEMSDSRRNNIEITKAAAGCTERMSCGGRAHTGETRVDSGISQDYGT